MGHRTLQTKRLILRQFDAGDVDGMLAILRRKEALRYFPPGPEISREKVARMIERLNQHWDEHGFGLWAVTLKESGRLIGRCGLQTLPETGEVEVDFILNPDDWGQGYASEAGRASVVFGFRQLTVDEIVGIVHPDNAASRRTLEKLGMVDGGAREYFGMAVHRYAVSRGAAAPPANGKERT